ncbi:hypothetical protein C8Q73DRAFT_814547 [Cubamyces lactineus]|nr:hypothetical protein C8Q73DRAFT_814547 [Cubamyces lactineus]
MPHPDRIRANGLEVECPPIIAFIDDVSGNTSKQWNVHYSCYISNATLPRSELEKDSNIHFVATSPHASPLEIIHAICELLKKSKTKLFKVWDAVKKRHILIRPWILFLPGDNPMQAELCSHVGLQGNHFCRMCHGGGDQNFKASDEGFASLLQPGRARTVPETREAITTQLMMATHAAAEKPVKAMITSTSVKDSFALPILTQLIVKGKLLRRATPQRKALSPEMVNQELYREVMQKNDVPLRNPLLDMEGLDVHADTPVEPLHTHLLGVVKYFWAQTVWVLDKEGHFSDFQACLNSLSRTGLKIPNIMADYMCRYRGSLIGKHFKTISQVMAFALCGLVDDTLQDAWASIGRLTVLIWETDILDMSSFVKELRATIQDTIDFAAKLSPGLLTEKNKFHILAHLPDHVEHFGPPLLFSTERYESFNHIFRLCSIHSNRQAPSRDIARTFANQERCRHMVSGGYWWDKGAGKWTRAGDAVLWHISTHRIHARLLGLTSEKPPCPGDVTLFPLPSRKPGTPSPQRPTITWTQTDAARLQPDLAPLAGEWHHAASIVAQNGDTAPVESEVIIRNSISAIRSLHSAQTRFASIVEIISPTRSSKYSTNGAPWVIVRDSIVQGTSHVRLKMPVIHRIGRLQVIRPKDILCVVNVQHDCTAGMCTPSGSEQLRQERELSTRARTVVEHQDRVHYVINLAALHNQGMIRSCLPPPLCSHPTFFDDRTTLHKKAAESLRVLRRSVRHGHPVSFSSLFLVPPLCHVILSHATAPFPMPRHPFPCHVILPHRFTRLLYCYPITFRHVIATSSVFPALTLRSYTGLSRYAAPTWR